MTKEEVSKRQLLIKDETKELATFKSIVKSPAKIKKKLIEELTEVGKKLDEIIKQKDDEKKKAFKKTNKRKSKKR